MGGLLLHMLVDRAFDLHCWDSSTYTVLLDVSLGYYAQACYSFKTLLDSIAIIHRSEDDTELVVEKVCEKEIFVPVQR